MVVLRFICRQQGRPLSLPLGTPVTGDKKLILKACMMTRGLPVFPIRDKDISPYIPACPTTITIGTGGVKVEAGLAKVRECFAGFNDHLLHQDT